MHMLPFAAEMDRRSGWKNAHFVRPRSIRFAPLLSFLVSLGADSLILRDKHKPF
jgi:hypothetical protein